MDSSCTQAKICKKKGRPTHTHTRAKMWSRRTRPRSEQGPRLVGFDEFGANPIREFGAKHLTSVSEGPVSTAINASVTVDTSDPDALARNMPSFCYVSQETRDADAAAFANRQHQPGMPRMPWGVFDSGTGGHVVHGVVKVARDIHDRWNEHRPRGVVRPRSVTELSLTRDAYHFLGVQIGEPLATSGCSGLLGGYRSIPYDTVAFTFGKHAEVYNMWTRMDGTQAEIFDLLYICVVHNGPEDELFLWPVAIAGHRKVCTLHRGRPAGAQIDKENTGVVPGTSTIVHYWFIGTLLSEVTVHVRPEDVAAVLSVNDGPRVHPDVCGMALVEINVRT